ncbi:MAG: MerR family DNA-binding protein [Frankiales bacterium]|nr:MerR family DNA-binding protein [Frankiales bacterium]
MKIGELAHRHGITAKTLRYYEEIGLVLAASRTSSGYRDYDQSSEARLTFIRSGQAIGLSLAEIRDLLAIRDDGRTPCAAATELLDDHLDQLTERIRDLQSLRRDLRELRARAVDLAAADCLPDTVCHIINPGPCTCSDHGRSFSPRDAAG